MTLLAILRQIQRPTEQGYSSRAKYVNSRNIILISYDTNDNTHRLVIVDIGRK